MKLFRELKIFLLKLRSSDERRKKRWLIGSTVVIMVIVIYVWLAYFNYLFADLKIAGPAPEVTPASEQSNSSFWQTMKNGVAVIYRDVIGKINEWKQTIATPKDYIIKP